MRGKRTPLSDTFSRFRFPTLPMDAIDSRESTCSRDFPQIRGKFGLGYPSKRGPTVEDLSLVVIQGGGALLVGGGCGTIYWVTEFAICEQIRGNAWRLIGSNKSRKVWKVEGNVFFSERYSWHICSRTDIAHKLAIVASFRRQIPGSHESLVQAEVQSSLGIFLIVK